MKTLIKKSWAALSLRATLTIAFLTFGVLVLSISSGLQSFSSLQTQQTIIASNQHLIAQEAARSVSYFILEKLGVLETTIWIAEPATMSPAEQQLMLDSLLGLQPAFSKLVLLNAQDQALAQATRLPQVTPGQLTDQLDENVLAKTHQKERYISPVYIDPVTSEPLVTMAVPVTDVFGDFKGSLVAEVNLKFMWDLVAQLKVGETGYAYVVDRQGNLIAFGDTARVLRGENAGHFEAVREFIDTPASAQATGVSIYRGITGAMVAGTYVPLGTPDWAVVTELPWEEAYQEVIRQVVMSIGITLVMAVMAGLLGVLVARRLAVPLVNLMETSTRIAGGERELQAGVSGPRELASLARAFNSMTAQLQQSLESLEQQVVEVKRAEESLRQANETLQVSERNYREVFNATSDALLIHDETAQVLDVNDRMCTMFGYDHETARGLSVGDLSQGSPPYSQPEVEDWVHRAVKEGPQVFEWLSKRCNGELFWSEVALRAGEIAGERRVIASVRDITERKKAEQALRKSEERLRQIASSLREVIWLRDVQTRQVLYVNPAFGELTGQTCESFYENPDIVIDATHPDDKERVIKALDQRFESAPFDKEHRIIRPDGSVRWVSSRSFPVRNEAGEVYRWASTMEDITERKRAEEALRDSEKRYRLLFDNSLDAFLLTAPEGEILAANPAACRMFDRTEEEIKQVGRTGVVDAHDPRLKTALEERARTGKFSGELTLLRKDGSKFPGEMSSTLFTGPGGEVRTSMIIRDITERKRTEEALRLNNFALERTSDAVYWINLTTIVDVNESACRMLGYSRDEFRGMSVTNLDPKMSEAEMLEAWEHVKREGAITLETQHKTKDGRIIPVEVMANYIAFEGKELNCCFVRDITERKQAEEAIRLNSFALERTFDAVHWINVTQIVDVNEAACNMLGYSREELIGMSMTNIDPVMPEADMLDCWEHIKKEGTITFEAQHKTKDGRLIPVEIMANYIAFEGKELNCCFVRDITERKRAEEALRLNSFAVEQASDAVYWINEDFIVTDVNEAACNMLGYSREELIGMSVTDIDAAKPEADMSNAWEQINREGSLRFETQHKTKEGHIFPVEVVISHISHEGKHLHCAFARDITERKQAAEALHRSEERLRQAVRVGNIGIFDRDHINDTLYWSPELRNIYGWGLDEPITQRKPVEQAHPDDREKIEEAIQHAYSQTGDGSIDVEYRIIDRSGAIHWLSTHAHTFFEGKGSARHPVRTIGAVADTTERKQAEEALHRSEARYRAMVESQIDLISRYRPDTTLTFVNDAYCQFYGKTREELIGQSFLNMVAPEFRELARKETESMAKEPGMISGEYLNYAADGTECWIQWIIQSIVDENGQVVELQAVGRDITRLKQTEEALRDSESRLSVVFNQSADSLALSSVEPDGTFRLVAANEHYVDRAARYYDVDFSGECCIGKTIVEILRDAYELPEADCDFTVRSYQQVVNSGQPVRYEEVLDTPAGRVYAEVVLTPIFEPSDTCRYILYSARDITERKQAEAEIRQLNEELEKRVLERTKELEEANEEIKQFAYIVSHDLRAPLVNLKGFAAELRSGLEVVKEGCDEVLPLIDPASRDKMIYALQEDIPEALRFIESSVGNMDTFTKAILKLSRLGRLRLEPVEVDARVLVEKTLETLSYQINQQGVKITVGDLPVVTADFVSMEQIFGNILNNAVAYLDPNRPGEIEISAEQIAGNTVFRIRDNGRGIAKEDMDKVFVPFRRAGKQDVPGEGMGLAYVQTLVRRHGGHIWCNSEAGVGTTFTFTIPRNLINDTVEP